MKTRGRVSEVAPEGVELDLVAIARRDRCVVGADDAVDRLEALLGMGRRRPVLVGPSEVGKSAMVKALAQRIARGARPGGATAVWQVSLRTLEGLCRKDDDVPSKLTALLAKAAESPARPVVYVRDLWCLRRYDAEHALASALAHGDALFVGEARASFPSWVAESADLAAVVHVVRVDEATVEDTRGLLELEAASLARHEGLVCESEALDRVVRYAERLMPSRRFPGKALALFDEVTREARARPERRVTAERVTERVCESLHVPRFLVDPATPFDVEDFVSWLRARVVGQDDAIDAFAQCVALYKADLRDRQRPMGVVLLAGPPGAGKTLLARLVAEYLFGSADRMVRIPMGEHSEDWKIDQLFGQRGASTADGRRGLLARRLAGCAFSVVLLDEIEKADPLAYKHLLGPLGEGTFTTGSDEEVSLSNTLVILTTSVGAEVWRDASVGFARGARGATVASVQRRLAELFPAELLDRVDRISVCPPLGPTELREVASRELRAMISRAGFERRGIALEVDDEVLDRVVAESAESDGVRALLRGLERCVMRPLAAWLLRSGLDAGTTLRVQFGDGPVASVDRSVATTNLKPLRATLAVPRRASPAPEELRVAATAREPSRP